MKSIFQILCLTWACALHAQVSFTGTEQHEHLDTNLVSLTLHFSIDSGFYIQSDQPLEDHLIPSDLYLAFDDAVEHTIKYSPPVLKKGWSDGQTISVFDHSFSIDLQVLQPDISNRRLSGTFRYQACDQQKCYFPKECQFEIELGLKND
jgi:hypothetical protein